MFGLRPNPCIGSPEVQRTDCGKICEDRELTVCSVR